MISKRYEDIYVQGNIEYRKVIYNLLYNAGKENGFIDFLKIPRSEEEICINFGYDMDKVQTLRSILKVLKTIGVVAEHVNGGPKKYSVISEMPNEFTRNINKPLLKDAIGETKANEVLYAKNLSTAYEYLKGEKDSILFGKEKLEHWKNLLQFHFWEYGRNLSAEEIAFQGGRVIDLACGLGFGTEKLSELVGEEGRAVGIEMSSDFVLFCRDRNQKRNNIIFIEYDLNEGIPQLPYDSFNGAMMIGAFHFIKDKDRLLNDLNRVLSPKAKMVIGNVIRKTDAYDQAAHELSISMLNIPAYLITPEEMEDLFARNGFNMYDKFDRIGSAGWYCLEKI